MHLQTYNLHKPIYQMLFHSSLFIDGVTVTMSTVVNKMTVIGTYLHLDFHKD